MTGRTRSDQETEPLAFHVHPQGAECFDSWIGRVAGRHEVTRARLFHHLGIDAVWAGVDLACGKKGVRADIHPALAQLVQRLAWAVQADPKAVRATFVAAEPAMVLPPAMRRFGCPQCWLDRLRDGLPLIIAREWIMRCSWRCDRHGTLLCDLGPVLGGEGVDGRRHWLAREADRCAHLYAGQDYDYGRQELNRRALVKITGQAAGGFSLTERDYLAEFGRNQLHLVTSRTVLLGSAHSLAPVAAEAFAKLFPFSDAPRSYPPSPAPRGRPVTPAGLAATIATLHHHRCKRDRAQLDAVAAKLQRLRGAFAAYQASLDHVAAGFVRAWAMRREFRAAWEARDAVRRIVGLGISQIRKERQECESRETSLQSLKLALKYSLEAERRRSAADVCWRDGHIGSWAFDLPSVGELQSLIDARERQHSAIGTDPRIKIPAFEQF